MTRIYLTPMQREAVGDQSLSADNVTRQALSTLPASMRELFKETTADLALLKHFDTARKVEQLYASAGVPSPNRGTIRIRRPKEMV